ncbi:ABC transporter transmembrane domain-containing protein [Dankookia sp. P2]|uniref:ABC transporter transmembrane domain-containing protein n=1 Tax=Dankookia sp. P2 TaxID=3423955 RepID=UPI003D67CDCA
MLGLSQAWFETARTGDILSRLTADVTLLQSLIGSALSMGLRNVLTGIGAFGMLLVTSPKLAGIVALVVPFVVAPLVLFGRREKRLCARRRSASPISATWRRRRWPGCAPCRPSRMSRSTAPASPRGSRARSPPRCGGSTAAPC